MNEFTPEQIKMIETWTEKRDLLLREIGVYQGQLNDLQKNTKDEGFALAELHKQIEFAKGRLNELDDLEERKKNSLTIEVAELEARKSRLESDCEAKEKALLSADAEEKRMINSIAILCEAHNKMSDQAKIVNEVVGNLIKTAETHFSDVNRIMTEVKTVSSEIIEKGNENVKQASIILEKLPRYIFELQKPIPVRRTYAAPRGQVIEPENKQS